MSKEIPYQPMHESRREIPFEETQALLARRCAEAVARVKVHVEPEPRKPFVARLVWKKVSDWCIESNCGTYRIEKFAPGEDVLVEVHTGFRYRCLRLVPDHWFWQFDTANDPQEARRLCEEDLNAQSCET